MKEIKDQELISIQSILRMDYIKNICETSVLRSLGPSRPPFEKIVVDDEDDEELQERLSNRKYMLGGFDESVSTKANEFVEKNQHLIKSFEQQRQKLIWPIRVMTGRKLLGQG